MAKDVGPYEYAAQALDTVSKGAFLTVAYGGRTNTMTIGWGSIGPIWSKPIFTVLVRKSRFTHELIEQSGEFTVSCPLDDRSRALELCGTRSGRDLDKFEAAGLSPQAGRTVATPVIAGRGLHYECKIVYRQDMLPGALDQAYHDRFYADGDYHTLYYGEIVAAYLDD